MVKEKDKKILPPDLSDTTQLLKGVKLTDTKYALEDILQEFGEEEHTAPPGESAAAAEKIPMAHDQSSAWGFLSSGLRHTACLFDLLFRVFADGLSQFCQIR